MYFNLQILGYDALGDKMKQLDVWLKQMRIMRLCCTADSRTHKQHSLSGVIQNSEPTLGKVWNKMKYHPPLIYMAEELVYQSCVRNALCSDAKWSITVGSEREHSFHSLECQRGHGTIYHCLELSSVLQSIFSVHLGWSYLDSLSLKHFKLPHPFPSIPVAPLLTLTWPTGVIYSTISTC